VRSLTGPLFAALHRAGLFDRRGLLERPFDLGRLLVPTRVNVEGDRLVWAVPVAHDEFGIDYTDFSGYKQVTPQAGLLTQFVQLADAPAEQIAQYARRWGMLGLCEHGVPAGHGRSADGRTHFGCPLQGQAWVSTDAGFELTAWEPLELWRRYAREAAVLLSIAATLHRGEPAPVENWRALSSLASHVDGWYWAVERTGRSNFVRVQQGILQIQLNDWLALGGVRPYFDWGVAEGQPEQPPTVRIGAESLFGALALYLVAAVASADGFVMCAGCKRPYPSAKRQPSAGRRNFCPDCRQAGVPNRLAQRARRARLAARAESAAKSDPNRDPNADGTSHHRDG